MTVCACAHLFANKDELEWNGFKEKDQSVKILGVQKDFGLIIITRLRSFLIFYQKRYSYTPSTATYVRNQDHKPEQTKKGFRWLVLVSDTYWCKYSNQYLLLHDNFSIEYQALQLKTFTTSFSSIKSVLGSIQCEIISPRKSLIVCKSLVSKVICVGIDTSDSGFSRANASFSISPRPPLTFFNGLISKV